MSLIKIFSDSTCDLPPQLREEHQIGIVPLYVTFGEDAFKDGIEINPVQLYEKVDQLGSLPKTAAPSPADFMKAFAPAIEAGHQVLFIGISSEISSTYQNALIAAEEFPKDQIAIIDSRNLSTGIGILVMKAVQAVAAGNSLAEVEKLILEARECVETEFIIDTLDYLYKGGRCSSLQNFFGSLLKIRPVVKVVDGKMILASKIRGKRDKSREQLLQNALKLRDELDNEVIFVTHSLAQEEAELVRDALIQETNSKHVYISETGCVISSHCGPQTVGIVLARKA